MLSVNRAYTGTPYKDAPDFLYDLAPSVSMNLPVIALDIIGTPRAFELHGMIKKRTNDTYPTDLETAPNSFAVRTAATS